MVDYKKCFFVFLFLIVPIWAYGFDLGKTILLDNTNSYWEVGADNGLRAFQEKQKEVNDVNDLKWERATSDSLSKGYEALEGWFYFKTFNPQDFEKKIVIYFQKGSSDIDVYKNINNKLHFVGKTNQDEPNPRLDLLLTRMSAVEIINPPKSEVEWVVKVSTVPLNGYLKIKTKAHFQNTQYTEDMILLLIFGLLVGNSVFNFILYFIIKDRIYLLSALYSFSFFIYQLLDKNVGKFLFYGWIDITHFNYHISTMFSSTSALTSVILSQKFLRLPEKIKYFKTASNIILFSGVALLVFHLFNVEVKWKRVLSVYFGLICMVHILCMFVYTVRFKTRESFLFLFSYLPIFIGVIFFMLTRYGVLALPHISDQLLVIAAVFDAIFLSAGLADRINVLKEEKTEIELKSLKELGAIAIRMGDSLNTPLNVISLCVEEIKENEKSKEFSEEMDLIKKQVHHMNISLEPLKHYRSYSSHAVLVEPHAN